ncbi:transglutaminase-like putative cysteine protease [Larkinella arboricola]|uniref:Transglutaminase-like putative cysteine protease n=1 Tax=Larkinella arboricola TaxID=643671 RepID=A0A327WR23_LARAB|nr:DUF3857 domain-containing protein [Larkinella arboricola]RAJ93126.1 transglutaminase-like putative cysteine protease [Larkinella arboricola]
MHHLLRSCLLGFLLLISFIGRSQSTSRIRQAPAPEWRLPVQPGGHMPSAKTVTQGYFVSLIDIQTHLEKKAQYVHLIREIISPTGVQYGSEVSVLFNPAYEQLTFHSLTIHRDGKARTVLRPEMIKVAPLESERDRFVYYGLFSASIHLEDIRKGDRIEYAYTITGRNPILGAAYSDDIYFTASDPLPHRHHVLISNSSRALSFRSFNQPPSYRTIKQGEQTVYEWNAYDLKPISPEDYMPAWTDAAPHLQISEFNSWSSVVDWAQPLYQVAAASPALLQLVQEWKHQSQGNALAYLQQAVAFVQNDIRYLGIEMGDYSHQPHLPEQVLRQRYGDCKDKSLLLCTLLKAGGLPAYPALTNTINGGELNRLLPAPTVFNHVIVWTSLNGKTVWIDPTLTSQHWQDGYYIPPYGHALVIRPGEKMLQPVASAHRGKVQISETFTIPSPRTPDSPARLYVESVYSHNHAEDLRNQLASQSQADLEKSYLAFYQQTYPDQQVESLDSIMIRERASTHNLVTNESYQISNFWEKDSATGQSILTIRGNVLANNLRELPRVARKYPLALTFPYELEYTIRLKLPEDWNSNTDSWKIRRNSYEIDFTSIYYPADSLITLHYRYKTLKDHVPVEEIKNYRADLDKLTQELNYQLSFNENASTQAEEFHWATVLIVLIAFVGFGWLGWRTYHYDRPIPIEREIDPPLPIGGWLVLMGIGIALSPLLIGYDLLSSPLFRTLTWETIEARWPNQKVLAYGIFYAELLVNVFLVCSSVLMGILFFGRRNTFPFLYSRFLVLRFALLLADAILIEQLLGLSLDKETIRDVLRTLFHAIIWIPYLLRSQRVQKTFVKSDQNRLSSNDELVSIISSISENDASQDRPQT